jgi:hypothetical protein
MGDYHLVCVHPFGKYVKGQVITDDAEVAKLLEDRENHFNRVQIGAVAPPTEPAVEAPPSKPAIPRLP